MVIVIILDHPLRGSFSDIHPLSNNAAFVAIYIYNVLPPLDTSIQVFQAYLIPIILKICQLDSNSIDLLFILAYYGKKTHTCHKNYASFPFVYKEFLYINE